VRQIQSRLPHSRRCVLKDEEIIRGHTSCGKY
jgi:hypothetical protein